jgi:hypothetical protein
MDCKMCGKLEKKLVPKWYQYDNGEQFKSMVCPACALLHKKMGEK